ncbi:MAG: hypothetical protein EBT92_12680 [Planctomycetes bacterium]|nr:hypothetical protein [Planctomycetota bacterium]
MDLILNVSFSEVAIYGIATMFLCLVFHSIFLSLTINIQIKFMNTFPNASGIGLLMPTILIATFFFVVSSFIQIVLWCFLLMAFGTFANINDALYFSATTYTTLGTGKHVLVAPFRMLEPLEAATGMLVVGLNTAILFSIFHRTVKKDPNMDAFLK